jgi:hypothetical protein
MISNININAEGNTQIKIKKLNNKERLGDWNEDINKGR